MVGKIANRLIHKVNNVINLINLKRKKIEYGSGLIINGLIKLHGDGKIVFGKNVRVNSSERSNPIGGMEHTVISVYAPGNLSIGDNVGMSNVAINCRTSVIIEENVLIGGSVKIYDSDFHSLDYTVRGKGRDIDVPKTKEVRIQQGAFIGAHSIIMKGVSVGKHSIIGAGSVLTKSVPDNEIWAGNPAKFIRKIEEK